MALLHRRGEGVVKSDEIAASYYKKAMDKGHTPAIIGLAYLYRVGSGVVKNQDESFRLYKIAADKNNSDAYIGLALAYFNGEGVPINFSEGIVYLQKAVDANLPAGKHFMGDIKINGKYGQQIDKAQGLNLLKESAERNYPPALLQLGRIYENGDGVAPSIDEARKLYAKAASFNYNPAIIALNRLSLPPPPPVALSMPLPPPSPPSPPTAPLKADTSVSTNSFEAQAWNEAVKANSIQAFEAYINAFPNGSNVAVAKINLLGLKARK
jgi:TPR repeat protein